MDGCDAVGQIGLNWIGLASIALLANKLWNIIANGDDDDADDCQAITLQILFISTLHTHTLETAVVGCEKLCVIATELGFLLLPLVNLLFVSLHLHVQLWVYQICLLYTPGQLIQVIHDDSFISRGKLNVILAEDEAVVVICCGSFDLMCKKKLVYN